MKQKRKWERGMASASIGDRTRRILCLKGEVNDMYDDISEIVTSLFGDEGDEFEPFRESLDRIEGDLDAMLVRSINSAGNGSI